MLYVNDLKIERKDVVIVLPVKQGADAKSLILLADGQVVKSTLSSAALKKRLDGGLTE